LSLSNRSDAATDFSPGCQAAAQDFTPRSHLLGLRCAATVLWAALAAACTSRSDPPAPVTSSSAQPTARTTLPSASGSAAAPSPTADASIDASATDASVADAAIDLQPDLFAADGGANPQTDAMPSEASASFDARMKLLFRAIVEDAPEVADPAFFPVVAYNQVKAVPKPEVDWNRRLLSAYHRDIHAYHRKLGPKPEEARLVSIDVPMKHAHWVKPAEEMNKLGYDRVFHSKIRYVRSDGKEAFFDVLSMISWRGEWYVVHLISLK
jgi:hypothetical protein